MFQDAFGRIKLRIALLALFASLAAAVPLPLQQSTAEVRGVVRDAETKNPIAGVSVRMGGLRTTTDNNGAFMITGLPPGRHPVSANRAGYLLASLREPASDEAVPYRPGGATISVAAGERLHLSAYMKLMPVVSGTVIDSSSQPLVRASITAARYYYDDDGVRTLVRVGGATTNDLGEFELSGLPPGEYVFRAERLLSSHRFAATYYPSSTESSRAESVTIGASDIRLRPLIVKPGATLWIRLVDENGHEASGVWGIAARPRDEAEDLGERATGIQITLAPGSYDIEAGAMTGNARNRFPNRPLMDSAMFTRQTLQMPDKEFTVSLKLSPGTAHAGRLLKRESNSQLVPVPNAPIRWTMSTSMNTLALPFGTTTAADGTFAIAPLPAGSYRFRAPLFGDTASDLERLGISEENLPDTLRTACLDNILQNETPVAGDKVDLSNAPSTVSIVLRDSTTSIEGKVVNAKGNFLDGAVVALVPDDRQRLRSYASTMADQNGAFEFKCAPSGTYKVFAWRELAGAAYRNTDFMKKYEQQGTPITLRDNTPLTLQVPVLDR